MVCLRRPNSSLSMNMVPKKMTIILTKLCIMYAGCSYTFDHTQSHAYRVAEVRLLLLPLVPGIPMELLLKLLLFFLLLA